MRVLGWLVVFALLLPAAHGQAALLDDDAGDVTAHAQGTATPLQSPMNDAVDLRALSVQETEDTFDFTIDVEGFQQPEVGINFELRFSHGEASYLVDMFGLLVGTTADLTGYLLREARTGTDRIAEVDVDVDAAAATIAVSVPRHHLVDEKGTTPRIGHALEDIHVMSRGSETIYVNSNDGAVGWRDHMPDDGVGATYASTFGLEQSGDARLTSAEPFRVSNGEATTFIYTIEAHNDGGDNQTFVFEARGMPEGWDVYFPARTVTLHARSAEEVAVVVQTPFQHQHGDVASFQVEMVGQGDDGDVGRIELGVRYPDTPQPSGHHSRLWLHSQASDADPFSTLTYALLESVAGAGQQDTAYMNALEEDELSDGIDVPGPWCDTLWGEPPDPSPIGGESIPRAVVYCWPIPLSPTLSMGLDFDMAEVGRIDVPIHSTAPADGAWLGGQVIYYPPETPIPDASFGDATPPQGAVVLAQLRAEGNVTFAPDSTEMMSATIHPTPEGDLVPYQRGGSMWLWLNVTQERPETVLGPKIDKPAITPGGVLELPLLDYADPVDDIFPSADALQMQTTDARRLVNPGETAVFEVTIENRGEADATVDLVLLGTGVEWSHITGDSTRRIAASESTTVLVAVSAPADARDGERADLILEATDRDSEARSLVRLVAEADDEADHEDQAALAGEAAHAGKQSPGLPIGLLVVAWLVLARRR